MASTILLLCGIVFVSVIHSGVAIQCFECNVWKAGYGSKCEENRVRDGCKFCMKIKTKTYVGYYKNRPKVSEVESRVCGRSATVYYHNECIDVETMDGHSILCFCDTDVCNSAVDRQVTLPLLVAAATAAIATVTLMRHTCS